MCVVLVRIVRVMLVRVVFVRIVRVVLVRVVFVRVVLVRVVLVHVVLVGVVFVRVVQIRCVVVVVDQPRMLVRVCVLADHRRLMGMVVMPVVMPVHVVMLDRLVNMGVFVALGQMQAHTDGKQHRGPERPAGQRAAAHRNRDRGAEKRCDRKHRAGTRGSDRALREQVQP